jgi:hypothetical protein
MNPAISITMSADRSCTAGFTPCDDQPVEIGTTGYDSLTYAYAAADEGDEIKLLAGNLPESPNLNRQVDVTITAVASPQSPP